MEETIKVAQELLEKNPEWKVRYTTYLDVINNHQSNNKKIRLNKFSPLNYYLSISKIKLNHLLLDIRFRGQSVATLKHDNNDLTISTKSKEDKNYRDFGCKIKLDNAKWNDKEFVKFRRFFRDKKAPRNDNEKNKGNEEHNVESLLLSEFSKKISLNKQLTRIQPVKILGYRFSMPTPLSASNHNKVKYSRQYGGGIDILARTGSGNSTSITVIEVKDESKQSEPPNLALEQAVTYAVFIRELLRSDSGGKWYKIFGFKGRLPKKLILRAVCAMPDNITDTSFGNKRYLIENDIIECHYIYFKYDKNISHISDIQTSLPIANKNS